MRTRLPAALAALTLVFVAPARAATFAAPVVLGSGVTGPGIDIAPDGTVYVTATDGANPARIYRSANGGATWLLTPPGLRGTLPGGGGADLAVGPTGFYATTDAWTGSATVSRSTDGMANPVQGVIGQDRPWLAAGTTGTFFHATHQPAGIVVSVSTDGGLTYGGHVVAAPAAGGPSGNLVVAGGLLGFAYPTTTGGVAFARTLNGGLTWTSSPIAPAGAGDTTRSYPTVAVGGGNTLVAVWSEVTGSVSRVWLNRSTSSGQSWSAPVAVVTTGASAFPSVAAQGSKVAISLYHTASNGQPDTVPSGAAWYLSYLDSGDGGVTFSTLQTADPTAVAHGPVCTLGISCAGHTELGSLHGIAIDAAGRANIAYARSAGPGSSEVRYVREP